MGLNFYHPESRPVIEAAVRNATTLGKAYDLELELVSAKGNRKWVRTIGLPVRQGDRVVQVRGAIQDITELKQAEEEDPPAQCSSWSNACTIAPPNLKPPTRNWRPSPIPSPTTCARRCGRLTVLPASW